MSENTHPEISMRIQLEVCAFTNLRFAEVQMEDKVRRVAMFSFLFCVAKTFSDLCNAEAHSMSTQYAPNHGNVLLPNWK
jgi:hypothetical protein